MTVVAILVAAAVMVGLFLFQRRQAAGQAEADGQRMIAATQARFRRQMAEQTDLTQWEQDDIHAAHVLDLDEPAYKAEFDRRGLTL